MKINIDTNIRGYVKERASEFKRLAFGLSLVILWTVFALFFTAYKPLFRDFAIANIAHVNAGGKQPFTEEEAGYTGGFRLDPNNTYAYGMETNSEWVANYVRLIIPYMEYEKVAVTSIYPVAANVVPFNSVKSFHIAGRMFPSENAILLNERYFLDTRWNS